METKFGQAMNQILDNDGHRAERKGLFSSPLLILLTFLASSISIPAQPQILGDLDSDGQITVLDLVRLLNHLNSPPNDPRLLPTPLRPYADANGDGFLDQADVDMVNAAILGFPIPTRLTTILESSPSEGEASVSVTRETILRFTGPLSSSLSLSRTNLYAEFGNRKILSRVDLSPDRRVATLFYLEPLPGNAKIRVTLVGTGVHDFLGQELDPDGDGFPGGTRRIQFDTVSLTPNPDAVVCGRVFASQLATNSPGGTNQSINIPLAGVIVTADGLEESVRAVTDRFGNFRITNAPAGEFFVHLDGRVITDPSGAIRYPDLAYYPFVGKLWRSIPGREVNIGEVYLPLVAAHTLIPVSLTADTVVSFPDRVLAEHPELAGVSLTVPANSLFSDNGTRGGKVGIAAVPPDRLPEKLPEGLNPSIVITVQTDGASNFDQPVPVCFPNLTNAVTGEPPLPAGSKTALWSFNHDVGKWEIAGPMTISPDGRFACSDPGVGIRQPGWHTQAPGSQGDGGSNGPYPNDRTPPNQKNETPFGVPGPTCPTTESPPNPTDPILFHSGEFVQREVDLRIKGVGIDFIWARTHRSKYTHWFKARNLLGYSLGYGWDFSYNIFLEQSGSHFYLHNGNARRDLIFKVRNNWAIGGGGSGGVFVGQKYGDIAWVQNGLPYELRKYTNESYRIIFPDKGYWEFSPVSELNNFEQGVARLEKSVDRNGNTLRFLYDQHGRLQTISDTLDRPIQISYTPDNFISSVTDFTGRRVAYEHYGDGDPGGRRGGLKAVISPRVTDTPNANNFPDGKRTTYTYIVDLGPRSGLRDNLLTLTDGRRNDPSDPTYGQGPYLVNQYSPDDNWDDLIRSGRDRALRYDRVLRQRWGQGTFDVYYEAFKLEPEDASKGSVGTVSVGRSSSGGSSGGGGATAPATSEDHSIPGYGTRTLVRDRVGNVLEYIYDGFGHCRQFVEYTGRSRVDAAVTYTTNRPANKLRPNDPEFYVTDYGNDRQDNQDRIVHPKGNAELKVYAQASRANRNLLSSTRYPFSLNDQPSAAQTSIAETFAYDSEHGACCAFNFLTRHTDGRGNVIQNQYDEQGNLTNRIDRINSITEQFEYNARGQMTKRVHPDNGSGHRRVDVFHYYEDGPSKGYLQEEIADFGGFNLTNRYEYDLVGNITRKIDARGHDTQFIYNQLDQVVREISREVTSGSGIRYQKDFHYDANNNVKRVDVQNVDENGIVLPNTHFTTAFEFNLLNSITRKTEEVADGRSIVTEYDYDASENLIEVRHGEATAGRQPSNRVRYEYDERNLLFRETKAPGSPDQSATQYDYDGNRNLIRVTEGAGTATPHVTTMLYDGYDRLIARTDAMGNVTTYGYDANNNLVSTQVDGELLDVPGTNANVRLNATLLVYDALNRLARSEAAFFDPATQTPFLDGKAITRIDYSGTSQIIRMVNANGHTNSIAYDTASRRRSITDPKGNRVAFDYDANGNVVTLTETEKPDLGGPDEVFVTSFAYDNLNRLVATVDSVGTTNRYAYDSRGNRVRSIDGRGNSIRYVYDGLNRLTDTVRAMTDTGDDNGTVIGAITTRQTWDDSGRLTSQIDDNGNATTYLYDGLNRRFATVFADGTGQTNQLEVHGNSLLFTDANGNRVTSQYDELSRVVRKDVVVGPGVSDDTTFEVFHYDGLSRMVHAENDGSLVQLAYDSLGRVTRDVQSGQTVASLFDRVGNMVSCTYPSGRVIANTFDELERLKTVGDADGVIATYAYAGPGRVKQRDYKNGVRMTYAYDGIIGVPNPTGDFSVKQIIRTTHSRTNDGSILDDRAYAWDRGGNKISHNELHAGGAQRAYGYDSINRLIQSIRAPAAGAPETIQYRLDGVGNRSQVIGGANAGVYTMSRATPEPADFPLNQYTSTPFDTRAYDQSGNLTRVDSGQSIERTLAYDYRNRLVEFDNALSGVNARYAYDALTRRTNKRVTGINAQNVRFVYTGWRIAEEQDAQGMQETTYAYGRYIDEAVQMQRGAGDYYYQSDDLYSVTALRSASGVIREAYDYDDFGKPLGPDGGTDFSSALGNPFLFTGREFDGESRLLPYRTRQMDPSAARFMSHDVVGGWTDRRNLGNFLQYAGANPTTYADPFGLLSKSQCSTIRRALDLERSVGTVEAAKLLSNTGGKQRLGEEFNNQPIVTSEGVIDLDWFTDLRAHHADEYTVTYIYYYGKQLWNAIRGYGAKPFADPKELVAVEAIEKGKTHYGDLFPNDFLASECPLPEMPGQCPMKSGPAVLPLMQSPVQMNLP